jgi:WD40 repeat protein
VLATAAGGGVLMLWNLGSGAPVETLKGHTGEVADLRFGADGHTLFSAGQEGRAIAWDVPGIRRLGALFPTGLVAIPQDKFPPAFSISPDGRELAVARLDGKVDLIDARTLRTRSTFRAFDRSPATAIEYSPDGAQLAVAGAYGRVGLFDVRAGGRIGPLVQPRGEGCTDAAATLANPRCYEELIQTLSFAGRGLLATASIGGAVLIWDLERRGPIRPPLRLPKFVLGMDVSPDGAKLAVAFGFVNPENSVAILDVRSGRRLATLAAGGEPRSVAFSPDGRLLATGQTNGTAVLRETDGWRRVGRPLAHSGFLLSVRFSPDGRTLATSSSDGTIALWDVDSRKQIGSLLPRVPDRADVLYRGSERWVTARFTPKGSRLFAVYDNGHAARWELGSAAWARHACAVAGGGLTREQWQDVVPGQDYRQTCENRGPG